MAIVKPKNYYASGSVEPFKLSKQQRKTISARVPSDTDIDFVESAMSRYLTLKKNPEPTPAEVLASFEQGEAAIGTLMTWLHGVDDLTRRYISSAAQENNIPILKFEEYWKTLRTLDMAIEMGRREVPEKSRGRRENLSEVHLAMHFLDRWEDREIAKNVLLVVLPQESQRNINRFLKQADKRLNQD